jgi:hypothetical protein
LKIFQINTSASPLFAFCSNARVLIALGEKREKFLLEEKFPAVSSRFFIPFFL